MLGVIRSFAQREAGPTAKLREQWNPGIDAPAVKGRADSGDIEIDLVELFTDLGGLAADVGKGIAVFIDEMQDLGPDDVSALCAACHEISQSGLPVIVVGAGLPAPAGGAQRQQVLLRAALPLPAHRPAAPRGGRPGAQRARRRRGRGVRRPTRSTRCTPRPAATRTSSRPTARPSGTAPRARRSPPPTSPSRPPRPSPSWRSASSAPATSGRRRGSGTTCGRWPTPRCAIAEAGEGVLDDVESVPTADVAHGPRQEAAVALAGPRRAAQEGADLLRRARPDRLHGAALRPLPARARLMDVGVLDWVVSLMRTIGAPGVGVATALETVFPPVPSEVVLPLAGFTASQGHYSGARRRRVGHRRVAGRGAAALLGRRRAGASSGSSPPPTGCRWSGADDIQRAIDWFRAPRPLRRALRPAGAGCPQPGLDPRRGRPDAAAEFLLFTLLGSPSGTPGSSSRGYLLGSQWHLVEQYVGDASRVVYVLLAIAVVVFAARRIRHRVRSTASSRD